MANEIPPGVLRRFRRAISAYHNEVEELTRVLEALEAAGLVTFSRKKVERTHYLLEGYLEKLDRGEFGPHEVAKIVAQLEDHVLGSYSSEDAFEKVRGAAVQQMDKVARRWSALNDLVFKADTGIPVLELDADTLAEIAAQGNEDE